MTMISEQVPVWRNLVDVWPINSSLKWRPSIERWSPSPDSRVSYPERTVFACRGLGRFSEFKGNFGTSHLEGLWPDRFKTRKQESASVNGLLRTADFVKADLPFPQRILMVGAESPLGLYELGDWLRRKGWDHSHITLIDRSAVAIETVRGFMDHGLFGWGGGVDLIKENMVKHSSPDPYNLIVADILNPSITGIYAYPQILRESPYKKFELMLQSVKNNLVPGGLFLSRCLVLPEEFGNKPIQVSENIGSVDDRVQIVLALLGDTARGVDGQTVRDALEELYNAQKPISFCGRERYDMHFRPKKIMRGKHGIKVLKRLHNRYFDAVRIVEVYDETNGHTYLTFICKI